MTALNIIVITAASLLAAKILLNNIVRMLCSTENELCSTENYRGRRIPAIGGIAFVPIQLLAVLLLLLSKTGEQNLNTSYIALVLSMGFSGVVDDLIGDKKTKGLTHHIKSTLKGAMTTGFLKAFIGFSTAFIISIGISDTYSELIVNVLIISLFANTINLFDLRPGRAAKVFTAFSVILLASSADRLNDAAPLLVLFLTVCLYMGYDLKEICMLGDTGANILGITLGYYSVMLLGIKSRLMLLALLVMLNALSERLSISDIIKNSRLLTYLDELGRGQRVNR